MLLVRYQLLINNAGNEYLKWSGWWWGGFLECLNYKCLSEGGGSGSMGDVMVFSCGRGDFDSMIFFTILISTYVSIHFSIVNSR